MSRHSKQTPKTVADFVAALQKIDQSLPVHEPWDDQPGWFEVVRVEKIDELTKEVTTVDEYVTLGTYLDSAYAQMYDHLNIVADIHSPYPDAPTPDDAAAFGGLMFPQDYDRDDWNYGD